jgi:hypothetical protein
MKRLKSYIKARWHKFSITYLGTAPAGTYERYGGRNVRWSWYFNSMVFPIGISAVLFCNGASRQQVTDREEIVGRLDFNRQRFYGREAGFRPEMIDKFSTMYDSTRGFVQVDLVTGISKTTEGRYAGPPNYELEERLSKTPVTESMITQARTLVQHVQADALAQKTGGVTGAA